MDQKQRWEDLKSAVLEQVDVQAWAQENLDSVSTEHGGEVKALCLYHDETVPSLYINQDRRVFYCQGCGEKGNIIDLYMKANDVPFKDAVLSLAQDLGLDAAKPAPARSPHRETPPVVADRPPISKKKVAEWHEAIKTNTRAVKHLIRDRGLLKKTLTEHRVGWDGRRITIPIYAADGETIVNVRRYEPGAKQRKMIHYVQMIGGQRHAYGSPGQLYGLDQLVKSSPERRVHIAEGEWDRLLLCQQGWVAVTGTHGSKCWRGEWNGHFKDRDVVILYDTDHQGQAGAKNVARKLSDVAKSVRLVYLPLEKEGSKDVTDWFVAEGRTKKELSECIEKAKPPEELQGASDEQELDFEVHAITAYKSVPAKYVLDITPRDRPRAEMEINGDTLCCPTRFKRAFLNYFQRVPEGLPGSIRQWDQIVNQWLDRARHVEMPPEASELAALRVAIEEYLQTTPVSQGMDEFFRGRPVLVEGIATPVLCGPALYKIMQQSWGEMKRHTFAAALRRLGCEPRKIHENGTQSRAWCVPENLCAHGFSEKTALN